MKWKNKMMFVDYNFKLLPDGSIEFDSELNAEKLGMKQGDMFAARCENNKIILRKIPYEFHKMVQQSTS
jgi:hypothetical protein